MSFIPQVQATSSFTSAVIDAQAVTLTQIGAGIADTFRGLLILEGTLYNDLTDETASIRFMLTSDGTGNVSADVPETTADGLLDDFADLDVTTSGGNIVIQWTGAAGGPATYHYTYNLTTLAKP